MFHGGILVTYYLECWPEALDVISPTRSCVHICASRHLTFLNMADFGKVTGPINIYPKLRRLLLSRPLLESTVAWGSNLQI